MIYIPTKYDIPWFELDKNDDKAVAAALMSTVRDIEQKQTSIFEGNRRHARIYAGYLPASLSWASGQAANSRAPFAATKALIRSVCDTATALISRFRPKSSFITTGANWEVQKQAEDMDLFCAGAYERGNVYQTASQSFHDTTIFGTGLWKLVPRGEGDKWRVATERVQPDNLVVDEEECGDRVGEEPENTYHRILVRPSPLIKKYANKDTKEHRILREAIRGACGVTTWPNRSVPKDHLVLVEAIHVDEEGDNRRVLAGDGFVLKDEKWDYPWHPYVVLHWVPPISGFYGDGVAYRQFGRQERITYMYRWVQRCHDLFATPRAWVDPAGGPPTLQLTNEIGAVIHTRKPPVFQVNPVVPPEIYTWIDDLARGGFEDEGISQTTASNMLPPGLESAPAQREYSFKESNRFAPVSQRWEHAVAVETATKMIAMYRNRATSTKDKGLKVKWADRKLMYSVNWPDLDEDAYHIRAAASSLEALSPASRLQAAIELSQTGWLRQGEGRALMGHPDLERSDDLDNAGNTYAEMVLQRLLKGEFVQIDEYSDFVVLDKVVRSGRLLAVTKGAPSDLIDNCSEFLDRLDKKIADANAAAMMGQQAPMGTEGPANSPLSTAAAQGAPLPMGGGASGAGIT